MDHPNGYLSFGPQRGPWGEGPSGLKVTEEELSQCDHCRDEFWTVRVGDERRVEESKTTVKLFTGVPIFTVVYNVNGNTQRGTLVLQNPETEKSHLVWIRTLRDNEGRSLLNFSISLSLMSTRTFLSYL